MRLLYVRIVTLLQFNNRHAIFQVQQHHTIITLPALRFELDVGHPPTKGVHQSYQAHVTYQVWSMKRSKHQYCCTRHNAMLYSRQAMAVLIPGNDTDVVLTAGAQRRDVHHRYHQSKDDGHTRRAVTQT